jgi:hypothetical protein
MSIEAHIVQGEGHCTRSATPVGVDPFGEGVIEPGLARARLVIPGAMTHALGMEE